MWPGHRGVHGLKSVRLHQDVIRLTMLVDSARGVYGAMSVATDRVLRLLHPPITTLLPSKPDTLTVLPLSQVVAIGIARHLLGDNHYFTGVASATLFLILHR